MGIVMTASAAVVEVAPPAVTGGLTRTILLEVMGEDTTIEDGLVTTVETTFPLELGCSLITGLEMWEEEVVMIWCRWWVVEAMWAWLPW